MSEHLELKVKIKRDNVADSNVRELLYRAFDYYLILAREEQLRAESCAAPEALVEEVSGVHMIKLDFAEDRIQYFRQELFSRLDEFNTTVEKLIVLKTGLSHYGYFNEQPRALLDVVGPEFFAMFPQGEIWFVELDSSTLNELWKGDFELQERYVAPPKGGGAQLDSFERARVPHESSGLESGLTAALWLQLMMFSFYPFVHGVTTTSHSGLLFLFLPDRAFNSLREYRFDLYRSREFELMDIYRDGRDQWMGIKSHFSEDAAVLTETQFYFEWYIRRCSALIGELLEIHDVKQRFITTLTLNRLAVDTRIIETSDLPYLMKLLFFGVLDKYANLYRQLGLAKSRAEEIKVWKNLLTRNFYESELESALQEIPGRAGDHIRSRAKWIFDYLRDYGPSPEVLRELRNSYHGYGIREINTLLSHSGELDNDVPGLANVLWHWLLAMGLPHKSALR